MQNENYLNFKNLNLERNVYRYIPISRLYELFDRCENVLVHPSKWKDGFENLVLNSQLKFGDDRLSGQIGLRERYYCQCWTSLSFSDAFWQIYNPSKCAIFDHVRVRSTLGKLGSGLSAVLTDDEATHSFIGRTRYLRTKEMDDYFNSLFVETIGPEQLAKTLLVKRKAFKHEEEVRLVHRNLFGMPATDGLFRYTVDPHDFITQIMIDPRMDSTAAIGLKKEIKRRTGFTKMILHSKLYEAPAATTFAAFTALGKATKI